jgi:hypothetical protein
MVSSDHGLRISRYACAVRIIQLRIEMVEDIQSCADGTQTFHNDLLDRSSQTHRQSYSHAVQHRQWYTTSIEDKLISLVWFNFFRPA